MDYDKTAIPMTYDAGRDFGAAEKKILLEFFTENLSGENIKDIIDLGCGTARFSQTLADVFEAQVFGVDPSLKMLDQARDKTSDSRITFIHASAEDLPIQQRTIDMVFMSMVLHHLTNPQKVACECHRVLKNGGYVSLRNTTSDEVSSYPYLKFFPSIQSIIKKQLISREQLNAMYDAAGFELAAHQTVRHEIAPNWRVFVDKIALKADSFIARLAQEEFETGLAALRAHSHKTSAGQSVGLNVDLFLYRRH